MAGTKAGAARHQLGMKPLLKLVLVVCLACANGDPMKHLESLWRAVATSTTAESEAAAVEQVWEKMADERISVQLQGKVANGTEVDLSTASDTSDIQSVKVTFSKDGQAKTFVWTPIRTENAYLLFREK